MSKDKYEKYSKLLVYTSIILIIAVIVISKCLSRWNWIETAYWLAGIVVPLITLASFFLVLATMKVQQEQLKIQEMEIENTKDELQRQNKTVNLQRFDNTFFLLIENLNRSYYKIMQSEPDKFKNVIKLLEEEINKEFESLDNQSDNSLLKTPHEKYKQVYKVFYNGCLNTEDVYLNLGLDLIYSYFIQIIKLLIKNKGLIDDDEYYFDFIIFELDRHIVDLLLYYIIYLDKAFVIKYLDDTNLISKIAMLSPINLSKDRGMWSYISNNAGGLNPYSLKDSLEEDSV